MTDPVLWPINDGGRIEIAESSTSRHSIRLTPAAAAIVHEELGKFLLEKAKPHRDWCHAQHFCHHWFEDECSDACDRGEHRGGHGHPGCTDRCSPISGSDGASG